jgi:cytochrome c556
MGIRFRAAGVALLAAALAAGAWEATAHVEGSVPDTPGGRAAATRHHNFRQLGKAFKTISDELKKDAPDKAAVAVSAQQAQALAAALPSWFPPGSGLETGMKLHTRPKIWNDPKGFAAAAARLQLQTSKLAMVASVGDMAAVKTQFAATGAACKACHDKFRIPEK